MNNMMPNNNSNKLINYLRELNKIIIDGKILAKMLALRLERVLPSLISEDQDRIPQI